MKKAKVTFLNEPNEQLIKQAFKKYFEAISKEGIKNGKI